MKNLQDATERICELKGSILALDALVTALGSVLPPDDKAAFQAQLSRHAELMRTALLHAPVSEHTIAAFEHDLQRTVAMVNTPVKPLEKTMAKGQQRSNKEAKKPSTKNPPPAKPISAGAVHPTITTVVPDRSKKKS